MIVERVSAMRPARKAALVIGGYAVCALGAWAVTAVHIAMTAGPDRQTYAAMYDFGDLLLFVAMFAATSVIPTTAGLWFLRELRGFWPTMVAVAVLAAATSLYAVATRGTPIVPGTTAAVRAIATFGVVRILMAPVFTLLFVAVALFARTARDRFVLAGAAVVEMLSFAYMAFSWLAHR